MAVSRRFQVVAAGFALGALAHATEASATLSGHGVRAYPLWRDGLFVGLDGLLAVIAVLRPRQLWLPMLLLVAQQTATHGREVVQIWRAERGIAWLSLVTMTFVVASTLVALHYRWSVRRQPAAHQSDAPAI